MTEEREDYTGKTMKMTRLTIYMPNELYEDMLLCIASNKISTDEYVLTAIGIAVAQDLRRMYKLDEVVEDDL